MRSETSFKLDGDLIVVDAIVIGPSRQAEVRLISDNYFCPSGKSNCR
jgi:hypothetical protein